MQVTLTQRDRVGPWSRKGAEQSAESMRHEDCQGNDQSNENESRYRRHTRAGRRADRNVGLDETLQQAPPE